MKKRQITEQIIKEYIGYLSTQERSKGTIEKYWRDTRAFAQWANGREVTKELAVKWKSSLLERGYAPVTINAMLSAVNGLGAGGGRGAAQPVGRPERPARG